MQAVLPDNISSCLYTSKFFEEEETKGFAELVKYDCSFMDIGAHIGYYNVLARYPGGDNSKIISIEPTTSTFDILKKKHSQSQFNTTKYCYVFFDRKNDTQ